MGCVLTYSKIFPTSKCSCNVRSFAADIMSDKICMLVLYYIVDTKTVYTTNDVLCSCTYGK